MSKLLLCWEDDGKREIDVSVGGTTVRLNAGEIKSLTISGSGTWHIQKEESFTPGDGK